jgi:hypothetical protein
LQGLPLRVKSEMVVGDRLKAAWAVLRCWLQRRR